MAGHSKWANIKHKKAATDAKKAKVLTKHSKILMVIGRNDPNPDTNASLRVAIANAKADSVPKDNIERILKKLSGEGNDGAIYTQQTYEGFGPDGIPFVVEALTDNHKRTFPFVRTAFMKNGGNLGNTGSVGFMFNHMGVITLKNNEMTEDELFEKVIECGAEDFTFDEEGESEVVTQFGDLGAVRDALVEAGLEVLKVEPQYRAKEPRVIEDKDMLERIEKFIEAIEEVEDVDEVFGGFEVSDNLIE